MDYGIIIVSVFVYLWARFGRRWGWKVHLALTVMLLGYLGYRCRRGGWADLVTEVDHITTGLPVPTTVRTALRLARNLTQSPPNSPLRVNQPSPDATRLSLPTTGTKRKVTALHKRYVGAQQKWRCQHCDTLLDEAYEVDHIIPLHQGGSNQLSNLQALCRGCHGKKTIREQL